MVIGNEVTEEHLKLIRYHIEKYFGKPGRNEVTEKAVEMEWLVNDVRMYLHFFEQYGNKLLFEISKM